jgi:hypothetical protein
MRDNEHWRPDYSLSAPAAQPHTQPQQSSPALQPPPERADCRARVARVTRGVMVGWLVVALAFWGWYLAFHQFIPQFLYYDLIFGLVGLPLWLNRRRAAQALQAWRLNPTVKFLLLGYGMVLLEEVFAAFANHLSEGFSLPLLILRIGQFWALNVLAFTGLIVGWALLMARIGFSHAEAFWLIGLWGLYAEHTIALLPGNPLAFLLIAPLNIFVYGLILAPAVLSRPQKSGAVAPTRRLPWIARYPLALLLPFICSILPVALLVALRTHVPGVFPPRKFIA